MFLRTLTFALCLLWSLAAQADFQPRAEVVADNVYAVVGPLGQRDRDNDGLNANYGFIVTAAGIMLVGFVFNAVL